METERCMLDLGENCYVVAKPWNGEMKIHVRQYKKTESRKTVPTRKGVTLNYSQWLLLEQAVGKLDKAITSAWNNQLKDELKMHLGGGVYASVSPAYRVVDLRHFWRPEHATSIAATRKGICLNKKKWGTLKDVITIIRDFVPELNTSGICEFTHFNQMGLFECSECNFFNFVDALGQDNT